MDTTVSAGEAAESGPKTPTKSRFDENFPVASRLIAPALRPHVHAFYLCVRAADDVADDPDRAPEQKSALLKRMDAALEGSAPSDRATAPCHDLLASLAETGVDVMHARHLLQAFMMDVTKPRYRNWSELINYCRYSAAPVGRYLLQLHGEDDAAQPMTDALCIALQILNHLQDCKDDYVNLDRVYIPEDWLREAGTGVEALDAPTASPELRRVLDRVLERTDRLIADARPGPARIRRLGLRLETAFIVAIAERLSAKLKRRDPVAGRVELSKPDTLYCAAIGLARAFSGR